MIELEIPGFGELIVEHLVLDFNGTIAKDGQIVDGVVEKLQKLAHEVHIHVLTADTHGTVKDVLSGLPVSIKILCPAEPGFPGCEAEEKMKFIGSLGCERVVAMGNGTNDGFMLKTAAIGVAIIGEEGCATAALLSSDVVVGSIHDALALLMKPMRLKATLRN